MRAFEITSIKEFTNLLFLQETFDYYFAVEAIITTYASFHMDGHLQFDFFDTDEQTRLKELGQIYVSWKQMKTTALQIIRGKRSPLQFRIVLQCSPTIRKQYPTSGLLPQEQASYFLNIQFQNKKMICTTGASLHTFSPDFRPDHAWDELFATFLRTANITFQEN